MDIDYCGETMTKKIKKIVMAAADLAEEIAGIDGLLEGAMPEGGLLGSMVQETMLKVVGAVMQSYPDGRESLERDLTALSKQR